MDPTVHYYRSNIDFDTLSTGTNKQVNGTQKKRIYSPIVLYSIAEIGRFEQSEPGGHCFTQKPFFSFRLKLTGHGVSMHVKSPSRLKHIRPDQERELGSSQFRAVKTRTFTTFEILLFAFIYIFASSLIWIKPVALWTCTLVRTGQVGAAMLTGEIIITLVDV